MPTEKTQSSCPGSRDLNRSGNGLTIDSTLSWRIHIDHLTSKLSPACYIIRYVRPLMTHMTLLLICTIYSVYLVFIQFLYFVNVVFNVYLMSITGN
jgi:hypothetical protein